MPFTDAVSLSPLNTHFASRLLFSGVTQVPWIAFRAGDSAPSSAGLRRGFAHAIDAVRAANTASPPIRNTWVLIMFTLLVDVGSRGQEVAVVREKAFLDLQKSRVSASGLDHFAPGRSRASFVAFPDSVASDPDGWPQHPPFV